MSENDWQKKPSAEGLGLVQDLLGIPNNQFLSKGDLALQQGGRQARALEAIEKVIGGLSPTEMRVICENSNDDTQVLERVQGQLADVLSGFMMQSSITEEARIKGDELWRDEQRDMEYNKQRQQQVIAAFIAKKIADLNNTTSDLSEGVSNIGVGISGMEQSLESVDETLGYVADDVADIKTQTADIRSDIGNIDNGVSRLNHGVRHVAKGVTQLNHGVQRVGDEVAYVGRGVTAMHKGQAIQTNYMSAIYGAMQANSHDNLQMLRQLAGVVIQQARTVSNEFEQTRDHTQAVFEYAVGEVVEALMELQKELSGKLVELRTSVDDVADELHTANVDRVRIVTAARIREAHIHREGNTNNSRACESAIEALTLNPLCYEQVFDGSWDDEMACDGILSPLSKRNKGNPNLQIICLLESINIGNNDLAQVATERLFECVKNGAEVDMEIRQLLVQSSHDVFPLLKQFIESTPWQKQSSALFFLCRTLMEADFEIEYARKECLSKAFKIDPKIQAYKRDKQMDLIARYLVLKLGKEAYRLKKYWEFSRKLRSRI